MGEIERRVIPTTVELRKKSDAGGAVLAGYAALFNSLSEDLGGFREMLLPGCFDRSLAAKPDVLCRAEHDSRLLLGRCSSGTLRLAVDAKGLAYEVDVPDTQAGRDTAELCRRGDVCQSSFAFTIRDHEEDVDWMSADDGTIIRKIKACDLVDCAPVAMPAYTQTSVSARALDEARAHSATAALLPIDDDREKAWDKPAADGRVRKWASSDGSGDKDKIDWAKYGKAFFWHDAEAPGHFQAYKLMFADVVGGELKALAHGIFACGAVLQGARGGVDIPAGDVDGVKSHVARYYAAMRTKFKDDSIKAPWERAANDDTEKRSAALQRFRQRSEKREMPYEDKIEAIWGALRDLLGNPWGEDSVCYWSIEATYSDHAIVETDGTYMSYPVTFDADGEAVLGTPFPVEPQWVPVAPDAEDQAPPERSIANLKARNDLAGLA